MKWKLYFPSSVVCLMGTKSNYQCVERWWWWEEEEDGMEFFEGNDTVYPPVKIRE